ITFDEGSTSDCRPLSSCPPLPENGGGGRLATILIGPQVKSGYQSTAMYKHPSALRTMLLALGITSAPHAAASAPSMGDFFAAGTSNQPKVTFTSPATNATVSSPFAVNATFSGGTPAYMKLWVDGGSKYTVTNSSSLSTTLSLAAGRHRLTVQASSGGTMYA